MLKKTVLPALGLLTLLCSPLRADNEIGFIEKFALAPDREKVLSELVPGTEQFYFYHALHYQNARNAPKLDETMEAWRKAFPKSSTRDIIENREALLAYDADPQRTLAWLKKKLHLQFNHEQEVRDKKPDLPTALDPARISRDHFLKEALKHDDLAGVSERELERLVRDKTPLKVPQVRALLERLSNPDVDGLVELIAKDQKREEAPAYGSFPIHTKLLPTQLDQLIKLVPQLAAEPSYVEARLRKLQPGPDEDTEFDPEVRAAWLDRLWAYVKTLPPSFNSLKAAILYRRLDHDRQQGEYNRERFLEYLKLPRSVPYLASRWREKLENSSVPWSDLNASFDNAKLGFPAIGNDEPLVRDYFLKVLPNDVLAAQTDPLPLMTPYLEFVSADWLKPIFAEAMILAEIGKPERWAPMLSASAFQALKDRVDIEFAPDNEPFLDVGDDVTVDVFLKNVPKLIVRIYEINTLDYFLQHQRQLNTDLNLDGLVANSEATHTYSASPFVRKLESFAFPELKGKRGAWIIEFIGGGRSSRALIRTRQWSLIQRTGPAGDRLVVLDEKHQQVKDAVAWLDERKLTPEEKTGVITVPFSSSPSTRSIVLADKTGAFASLASFKQHGEAYELDAQFYLNREQLLADRKATLAIRASVLVGDAPQTLKLLKDAKLVINTTTLDGTHTTLEVKDVNLESDKLFTHSFTVPERLASIEATLSAQVEQLSKGGEKMSLTKSETWHLNGQDATDTIFAGHFSKFGDEYVYELLGKNGEALPDRAVVLHLKSESFNEPITVALRTDAAGRIALGKLEGMESVDVVLSGADAGRLHLYPDAYTLPKTISATHGDTIELPISRDFAKGDYSLFEMRDEEEWVADRTDLISATNGDPASRSLSIIGLPAGVYTFLDRVAGTESIIGVVEGTRAFGWVFGAKQNLELQATHPLNITSAKAGDAELVIKVANGNAFTRVHVAATRFVSMNEFFNRLGQFTTFTPASNEAPVLPNLYSGGREIGDEYRYILERRFAKTFPGNMLPRPGLLLNPWELRSTGQSATRATGGEAASATRGGRAGTSNAPSAVVPPPMEPTPFASGMSGSDPNLDFLANAAPVLLNLKPDKDGIVRVARKDLGDRSSIEVYAEDLTSAVLRHVTLPEQHVKLEDLRLARTLDAGKPFTEKKQVTVLPPAGKLILADVRTSEVESYDTLGGVFGLYTTLSGNAELAKFTWILGWPKLKEEEKRAKYGEFACHELNFFLSRKDPAFFGKVIQPYLANKKDKTFIDDYLLGQNLQRYLEPWRYARLNAAERALLGRRLPDETANTARHLRELWELLPPNDAERDRLFDTALRGRAMEMPGALVLNGSNTYTGNLTISGGTLTLAGAVAAEKSKALRDETPATPMAAPALAAPEVTVKSGRATKRALSPDTIDSLLGVKDGDDKPKPLTALPWNRPESDPDVAAFSINTTVGGWATVDAQAVDEMRRAVRSYFRPLGPVKEWAENNYWHLPLARQGPELITVNAFWRDLAEWDGKGAFVSPHFAEAHRNFAEIMLALGVLDLPFEAPKHQTEIADKKMTLTAGGPVVVFHKEILPAMPPAAQAQTVLVSQAFFRNGDRYRMEGNLKYDKYVTKEFLTGVVYGANLVVTNTSSAPADLDLLMQIPMGALPVQKSRATKSQHVLLAPYTTNTFEYYFYFPSVPAAGTQFLHYPVNVSVKGISQAAAPAFAFNVVDRLTEMDKASWDYVSQNSTNEETLAFLGQNNIERLDLSRVAWRCRKDAGFFRQMIALLQRRHRYDPVIYSYAALHNESAPLGEFLRHHDEFLRRCGAWLESKLVNIDPIERRSYEHLEYSPLVNQRAHRIGSERHITTPEERQQYLKLMNTLAHKATLDAMDQLSVVYYLFLQDRVEEALARFHGINAAALPEKLQLDYLTCYAAFYEGNLAEARGIASQHANDAVPRWRTLFTEVLSQLDEIEGKDAKQGDKPDREKAQAGLAASEPAFEFKIEKQSLSITWKNLKEVAVNYYLMDPEFAFSSSPFASSSASRFSIIKPNKSVHLPLPDGRDVLEAPLPPEYLKANVLIEVLGAGQRKSVAHHANTLKLVLAENYGRLEVADQATGKPLPKTYVKVYARLKNGVVRFFKDGYTDLRGRFDYASLNGPANSSGLMPLTAGDVPANGLDYQMLKPGELGSVEKLALLVMSETNGAEVKEVSPPSQ